MLPKEQCARHLEGSRRRALHLAAAAQTLDSRECSLSSEAVLDSEPRQGVRVALHFGPTALAKDGLEDAGWQAWESEGCEERVRVYMKVSRHS